MIYHNVTEVIGHTPIVQLDKYMSLVGAQASILAKVEGLNPGGSIKDRVAHQIILDAERDGRLTLGGTVIEATSGNTGIGLAMVARAKGYNAIMVMPDTMSRERVQMLKAYGAKVVLTDGKKGMRGSVEEAERLNHDIPNSIIASQFVTSSNAKAHMLTTGPEIWADTEGNIDIFVASVGTGGTLTGIGKYLKSRNPNIKVVAVEPSESPLLSEGRAGAHGIQGIGANFIPEVLDKSIIDEIITIPTLTAYKTGRALMESEAILSGISAGANLEAATILAKRDENKGKRILTVLPDLGDRYLSTTLFTDEV